MKCYYEILGVDRKASDQELKLAYRKQALLLHPDKNRDNPEATQQFQLLQQAYEVLSDPHERAFYDRHRESILKGGDESEDKECLDVYRYFTSSCYKGYGDDEDGFYHVYRNVFAKIAAEDMKNMDADAVIPDFGRLDSDYDRVVGPFYGYWQSYCTTRSYAWLEAYDIRQADNRRVARLIEKENKKVRDQARKKRNHEVRELVSFVRKRDKRVQAHRKRLEERANELAVKMAEKRERQKREHLEETAEYRESEWSSMAAVESQMREMEQQLAAQFGEQCNISSDDASDDDNANVDDGDEQEEFDELYCIACDKDFKSDKAYANHCRSKKHRENVIALKQHMKDEDRQLFEEAETEDGNDDNNDDAAGDAIALDEEFQPEVAPEMDDDQNFILPLPEQGRKNKKKKKKGRQTSMDADYDDDGNDDSRASPIACVVEEIKEPEKPQKLKGKKAKEAKKKAKAEETHAKVELVRTEVTEDGEEITIIRDDKMFFDDSDIQSKQRVGKQTSTFVKENFCTTCGTQFSSRNKMFEHLKTSGHAAIKGDAPKYQEPRKSAKVKVVR